MRHVDPKKAPSTNRCVCLRSAPARLLFVPDFGLSKMAPPGTTEDDTYKVPWGIVAGCGTAGCAMCQVMVLGALGSVVTRVFHTILGMLANARHFNAFTFTVPFIEPMAYCSPGRASNDAMITLSYFALAPRFINNGCGPPAHRGCNQNEVSVSFGAHLVFSCVRTTDACPSALNTPAAPDDRRGRLIPLYGSRARQAQAVQREGNSRFRKQRFERKSGSHKNS